MDPLQLDFYLHLQLTTKPLINIVTLSPVVESGVCSSEDFNQIIGTPSKVRRLLEDSNEVTKTN